MIAGGKSSDKDPHMTSRVFVRGRAVAHQVVQHICQCRALLDTHRIRRVAGSSNTCRINKAARFWKPQKPEASVRDSKVRTPPRLAKRQAFSQTLVMRKHNRIRAWRVSGSTPSFMNPTHALWEENSYTMQPDTTVSFTFMDLKRDFLCSLSHHGAFTLSKSFYEHQAINQSKAELPSLSLSLFLSYLIMNSWCTSVNPSTNTTSGPAVSAAAGPLVSSPSSHSIFSSPPAIVTALAASSDAGATPPPEASAAVCPSVPAFLSSSVAAAAALSSSGAWLGLSLLAEAVASSFFFSAITLSLMVIITGRRLPDSSFT
ncbi:hypothetical protein E2C01_006655 [Portunus trituberculatus]|uniref:Uncharacterized protein n=1 Tax=Portunus trituberculatus TaxID=210409 RepID=A0A5B7CVP7_PORTR|nr:hypothetical protein [Portunus trituberculatus]